MKLLIKQLTFAALLLACFTICYADEVVLIAHQSNSVSVLSQAEVRGIYLGKLKLFPGVKQKVIPIDQIKNSPVRKTFYSVIVEMSTSKLNRYWSKKIFSGRGTPPKQVNDDKEMIKLIAAERHALGYVYKSSLNDSVKVINIK